MDRNRTFLTALGRVNLEKIPKDVLKKVEKVFDDVNAKLVDVKNLYNGAQKTTEKLRKDLHSINVENLNLKDSLAANDQVVSELRQQLNTLNDERTLLTERLKREELDNADNRKKRNQLVDENDKLKEDSGRNVIVISQLQSDLASLKQQFETILSEKNDAITRLCTVDAKEQSMEDREKEMEKEIDRLNNEILRLNNKIVEMNDNDNKTSAELATAKHQNTSSTVQLETDLKEKVEELLIADFKIRQLTESIQQLTKQRDADTVQLKNQLDNSATLIEHCKREIASKVKFLGLYKAQITELNDVIKKTTEKCEQLEKNLNDAGQKHQSELTEKDTTIEQLKNELKAAGELLKAAETEQIEQVLEKKFPRAAASNRMLKDNLSLTEIYSRYHDSLADVHRLDVECLQLNTKVECLNIKLQETTTEFERQQIEYRKTLKLNEEITQQMDSVVAEQDSVREKFNEVSLKLTKVESENVRLKSTQKDLARQICNLLNKVEKNGDELSSDQKQLKRLGLSNESIRKELITFDNIVELQENNQKLILKVRELSNKVEKLEEQNIGMKSYEDKISYLERRLGDVEQARQANEEMLSMTSKQKERFKQLYYDAMSYMGKQTESEEMVVVDTVALNSSQSPQNGQNVTSASGKDKKLLEVEVKLQERMKELKVLKEEYNEHRKQSTINFDMLKEQCESVERKMVELQSANSKLQSQAMFTTEQMKSHQSNIVIYKKQIEILEERNQMYDKTIAKHELANKQLKEEAWNTIMQLSTAENRCGYLEMECRRLLEAKKNLETENNAFHRQKMTQSILESSCELAKLSSERSDFEGRILMEKQLEDHMRECRANTQKLTDERDGLCAEIASLKRAKESSIHKLEEEQSEADNLQSKLSEARRLIDTKNQQINDLSERLQAAFTTMHTDATISKKNRSFKDLEVEVKLKIAENEQLKMENLECAAKTKLLDKLKSDWDAEVTTLKNDLDTLRASESNSKSHINELQQEIRILSTKQLNSQTENRIQEEHEESVEKITNEKNKEIRELHRQRQQLKEKLLVLEKNYADAISAHSLDLQISMSRKVELNNFQEQMHQMKLAKDHAEGLLKAIQREWKETSNKFNEDRQELELKVEMLERQTMDSIDLMQTRQASNSVGTSMMNGNSTDKKLDEHSSENLFGVIKYLRREKDIAVTETEILKIENTRLLAELDIQRKRIDELCVQLNSTKLSINEDLRVVSPTGKEDLQRNVDTLNAVTDSNIQLRAENEDLCKRFRDLTGKLAGVEAELLQQKKTNQQLGVNIKQMSNENAMLRLNVDQLTRKGNALQKECENSVKMMAIEKENQRQLNEQLNLMKAEKSRLEQDIDSKAKHLQTFEEYRKNVIQEVAEKNANNVKTEDSKTVTTNHKRPRDAERRDSSTSVDVSPPSGKMTQRKKRTRIGAERVNSECKVPKSSERNQSYDVVSLASKDDVEKGTIDEAAKSTENFDADNGDSLSQSEELDIDENHDDGIDAYNLSSRVPVSSGATQTHVAKKKRGVNGSNGDKEPDDCDGGSDRASSEKEKAPAVEAAQVEASAVVQNPNIRRGRSSKRRLERK